MPIPASSPLPELTAHGSAAVWSVVGSVIDLICQSGNFGDMLARARPDRLQRASALFRSDDFKALMDDVATQPEPSQRTVNRVANSRVYRNWAETMGIDDPRNWLNAAILSSTVEMGEEGDQQ